MLSRCTVVLLTRNKLKLPMTNYFTPNDLLRFIYRETTSEEDAGIKQWLVESTSAAVLFQQLVEAKHLLEIEEFDPSETSVNIVLEYSEETAPEKSHA